jgi:ribosomal protein S18 acetylase RimI-like enzyme
MSASVSPEQDIHVRPVRPEDLPAIRALIAAELSHNPYATRALDLVGDVAPGGEYEGVVAERDGRVVGVVVFGLVAGSQGAGSLYAAAVDQQARRRGVGRLLVHAASDSLAARGAWFVMVEVPDDPAATARFVELLAASGFTETARVPDLYRDGVALAFWRLAL